MTENKENSFFGKKFSRIGIASLIAGAGALGYSLVNHESVQAVDSKNMDVSSLMVPGAEAMEAAGLVQMETEFPTEVPIFTTEDQNNFKNSETVNSDEGKETIVTFLGGLDRMINGKVNERDPKFRIEELAGLRLYFSNDTNKDGITGFSPSFLVRDENGEMKPYTFSKNSLEDPSKKVNVVDLTAGGEGYELGCVEIDGQGVFTRKVEGVAEQYLDNDGEWQYYISEEMAQKLKKFEGVNLTNWENPCKLATARDLKEGVILELVRQRSSDFSDKVYKNGKVAIYKDSLVFIAGSDLETKDEWYKMWSDPERKPIKRVGSFEVAADPDYGLWQKLDIDVFAIYNSSDETTSFLFYYLSPDFHHHVSEKRAMYCRDMAYTMPVMVNVSSVSGYIPKRGENVIMDVMYYEPEENKKLLKEWANTNKVPKELEGRLLIALTNKGDPDYSNREWSPNELLVKPW